MQIADLCNISGDEKKLRDAGAEKPNSSSTREADQDMFFVGYFRWFIGTGLLNGLICLVRGLPNPTC